MLKLSQPANTHDEELANIYITPAKDDDIENTKIEIHKN